MRDEGPIRYADIEYERYIDANAVGKSEQIPAQWLQLLSRNLRSEQVGHAGLSDSEDSAHDNDDCKWH